MPRSVLRPGRVHGLRPHGQHWVLLSVRLRPAHVHNHVPHAERGRGWGGAGPDDVLCAFQNRRRHHPSHPCLHTRLSLRLLRPSASAAHPCIGGACRRPTHTARRAAPRRLPPPAPGLRARARARRAPGCVAAAPATHRAPAPRHVSHACFIFVFPHSCAGLPLPAPPHPFPPFHDVPPRPPRATTPRPPCPAPLSCAAPPPCSNPAHCLRELTAAPPASFFCTAQACPSAPRGSTSPTPLARARAPTAHPAAPKPSTCLRVHDCTQQDGRAHAHAVRSCTTSACLCAGGRGVHERAAIARATPQHRSTSRPASCPRPPAGTRRRAAQQPRTRSARRYASPQPALVVGSPSSHSSCQTVSGKWLRVDAWMGGLVGTRVVVVVAYTCARVRKRRSASPLAWPSLSAAPLPHHPLLPLFFSLPFPSPHHSHLQLAVCTLHEVELTAPTKTSDRVCRRATPAAARGAWEGGKEGVCGAEERLPVR